MILHKTRMEQYIAVNLHYIVTFRGCYGFVANRTKAETFVLMPYMLDGKWS